MKTSFTVRAVGVIAGAAALWGTMLPGGASAEVPADQVPADLRAAIQTEIESRGETFAGMCREIIQNEHFGEWCAFVQEMDEDSAEVTFGPVASDEIYSQSFVKVHGEWSTGDAEDPQEAEVPAELRAAIKAFIEGQGKVYAGLCDEVQQTAQPGQYCAMAEVSGHTATVYYGRFASDEISTATFTHANGTWTVDGGQEDPQEGEVPAELRAAIKAFIEAQGKVYAGLCDEVQQTAQPGQYCAMAEVSGNTATLYYGPFASDEISTATFRLVNGEWTVDGSQEDPQEAQVPAELRAAIKAFIEAQGKVYAGLCDEVQQTAQPGQYCASVTISGNTATVNYGPFASDQISTTTFTLQNGVWKAANSATPTANPTPKPPSTGSGSESDDSFGDATAAAGAVVALLAVAGLGGALALRRKESGR